jgi:mRNA-degrading endonuclease toxin of MazEF toxin-antitoxin module
VTILFLKVCPVFQGAKTVRAIDNKRLVRRVGEVDSDTANRIRENLKIVMDLD